MSKRKAIELLGLLAIHLAEDCILSDTGDRELVCKVYNLMFPEEKFLKVEDIDWEN